MKQRLMSVENCFMKALKTTSGRCLPTEHRRDGSPRWLESPTGCWLWTGALDRDGYGRHGGSFAHRAVWEMVEGPIPAGLEMDHLCFVRCCVNPSHLEPVTRLENNRRAGERRKNTPLCPNGHERSLHQKLNSRGFPWCSKCNVESKKRLRQRRRVEVGR